MSRLALPTSFAAAHSDVWSSVRFRRAQGASGFVLGYIPSTHLAAVCARLFALGCKCLSAPYTSRRGHCFVHFSAPAAVAARLAGLFPAPVGTAPLALSASGERILSGGAAAHATRFQAVGRPRPAGAPKSLVPAH